MVAVKSKNRLTWFDGFVTRDDRERLHKHRGAVVWFTWLSASGKSTITHLVEKELWYRIKSVMTEGRGARFG